MRTKQCNSLRTAAVEHLFGIVMNANLLRKESFPHEQHVPTTTTRTTLRCCSTGWTCRRCNDIHDFRFIVPFSSSPGQCLLKVRFSLTTESRGLTHTRTHTYVHTYRVLMSKTIGSTFNLIITITLDIDHSTNIGSLFVVQMEVQLNMEKGRSKLLVSF